MLERQLLVGVGPEVRVPDPVQQLPEGRRAGGVGAQHKGVEEAADQFVQHLVGAARDRGAQGDVGARAEPGQQGGQSRLDDHERRGAGLPGERAQLPVEARVQPYGDVATPVRGTGRAGAVGRQREFVGESGQRPGPVLEVMVCQVARVAELPALPDGEIGVLQR